MADLAVMFHIPMSRVYSVLDDRTPSSSTPQHQQQQQQQQRYFDASSLNVGISHDGSSVAIASSMRACCTSHRVRSRASRSSCL